MFLFDPALANDWDRVKAELDRLMDRAGARIIVCGKWDERRLAYEIRGFKRALYVLAYFEMEPAKIGPLERDAQLAESVIRCLIVRADHLTEEDMKKAMAGPAPPPGDFAPTGGERESSPARERRNWEPVGKSTVAGPTDFNGGVDTADAQE